MTTSTTRRAAAGMTLIALLMVGVLSALGWWQLQRRTAKHELIATLDERLAEAPVPLPSPSEWPALTPAKDEFRRVAFTAVYQKLPDAMVYSSGSAVRNDVSAGTWAFLPAKLPGGEIVVVNAGSVPNQMVERAPEDKAVAPLLTGEPVAMTGYIRFPSTGGMLTPSPDPKMRLWFTRNVPAMADALGWRSAGPLAPFYIDLEAPVPASGVPKAGPLTVHLVDNHMQYAITWFGLAAAVAFAFAFWVRQARTKRPDEDEAEASRAA